MLLDRQAIEKIIPHRTPMLLVDNVLEIERHKHIKALKVFHKEDCAGHFPHNPVCPGIFIIEALAQAGAILVGYSLNGNFSETNVYLTSLNNVKFRKVVVPGDVVVLNVQIVHCRDRFWKFKGKAYVEESVVSEGEFIAMLETHVKDAQEMT